MPFQVLRRLSPALVLLPLLAAVPQESRPIVTDAATGAPVPYASIGVQNKPIGTVADDLGHFAPESLATAAPTDTLVVSCVGYQACKLLARDLSGLREVKLRPQVQDLQEVRVRAAGWKRHIDLKPCQVNVAQHERVAITLEWLAGTPTEKQQWYLLTIPAALSATHRMAFRDKPEDAWKVQPVNLNLYVTARSPLG